MRKLPLSFSHVAAYLAGTITIAIYHHWWINPDQVQRFQALAAACDPTTDIGYPGDWVLDILFPAIPLLMICLVGMIVSLVLSHRR